MDKSRTV